MTKKILIDEAVVKQAIWTLERLGEASDTDVSPKKWYEARGWPTLEALEAVIADQKVAQANNKGVNALAEQPDYSICPACGGMAADPIVPVEARQQASEPVVCDKDPRGCWNVRCQLGGVCKNTHPAPTQQDGTNGVVALQERLRQKPVALQPLTDEQIDRIADQHPAYLGSVYPHAFARAIEAAHHIGAENEI